VTRPVAVEVEGKHLAGLGHEVAGAEYLVAPYGEVEWVENVRATPDVR
jgi:hypothetical protein